MTGVSEQMRAAVARLRAVLRDPSLPDPTPQGSRAAMASRATRHVADPATTFEPADLGGVRCEWVTTPNGNDRTRPVVYLHGGGYVAGDLVTSRAFAETLARVTGRPVLTVGYRLAPEHPAPSGRVDTVRAIEALAAAGADATATAVVGMSAGGGHALGGIVDLLTRAGPVPAALVLISPWLDLSLSGASTGRLATTDPVLDPKALSRFAALYAGDRDPGDPEVSPLFEPLRGLPPTLVQVGELEVLLDDSTRFESSARTAGVAVTLEVWPGAPHAWHSMCPDTPEARDAASRMAAFIDTHTV